MDKLYVVTMISNPIMYATRYALYKEFAKHMSDSGVELYTCEIAHGTRPFEITEAGNDHHLQLRTKDELWHKENALNLMMARLPDDWKYVAWIDADISFSNVRWVEDTIHQLQHYDFVQMFSHAIDLDPSYEPMKTHVGFVYDWYHNGGKFGKGYGMGQHSGYAWAATRDALDKTGGILDVGILGSGDRHMACALVGAVEVSYAEGVHENYKKICLEWQERAEKNIKHNVGYVKGTILHYWHGAKINRFYTSRWKILVDEKYDPLMDTYRDSKGLLCLKDNKLGLRDKIRRYLRSRNESCTFTGSYKLLP